MALAATEVATRIRDWLGAPFAPSLFRNGTSDKRLHFVPANINSFLNQAVI